MSPIVARGAPTADPYSRGGRQGLKQGECSAGQATLVTL